MASKKEPKAKVKKEGLGGGDPGEAAKKKPKAVKVQTKVTDKDVAEERETKRDSGKRHKIRVPVRRKGTDAKAEAELDPFEVAKQTVKGSVPAIVEAMVEKAKKGSCTHAKTLLEMTGAKHMFDGEGEVDQGEPWAKLVLERLDEADSEAEPGSVGEDEQEIAAEQ